MIGSILKEFYSSKPIKVIYDKKNRNELWKEASCKSNSIYFSKIKDKCPALLDQIQKSYTNGNNIQSAVFSECVYSQTIANLFKLSIFEKYTNITKSIPNEIRTTLKNNGVFPRYLYYNEDKSRMLIQAGSCAGTDSVLVSLINNNLCFIEFKEPYAKSSEPDLPKYTDDGKIVVTDEFLDKYPQFCDMLYEQKNLNFFDNIGHNINNFTYKSIEKAIRNNYITKHADLICTEDKHGLLVVVPSIDVSKWAKISGEIRPAGRNHYKVWTKEALLKFLSNLNAKINENNVEIQYSKLEIRKERGGNNKVSGYKINPLFFVYTKDCIKENNIISFNINDVQQLNPTITAKMDFKTLEYDSVKNYYLNGQ